MSEQKIFTLHETDTGTHFRRRLGRHVHHDPRSKDFPAASAARIMSVVHTRHVPVYDQGDLGSCTGNAGAGTLCTGPLTHNLDERDAISLYADATHLDRVRGVYPPNDTGSTGLAIAKVLKKRGWITAYTHTFSFDHFLRALVLSPGWVGIAWRTGLDEPSSDGVARYSGNIRGGHEIEAAEIDIDKRLVWFWNSWGPSFGIGGRFAMTFEDVEAALADHGDACFPVL